MNRLQCSKCNQTASPNLIPIEHGKMSLGFAGFIKPAYKKCSGKFKGN